MRRQQMHDVAIITYMPARSGAARSSAAARRHYTFPFGPLIRRPRRRAPAENFAVKKMMMKPAPPRPFASATLSPIILNAHERSGCRAVAGLLLPTLDEFILELFFLSVYHSIKLIFEARAAYAIHIVHAGKILAKTAFTQKL